MKCANNSGTVANCMGASLSTPLFAGFAALINQSNADRGLRPVGFMNPALYFLARSADTYSGSFNDMTTGGIWTGECTDPLNPRTCVYDQTTYAYKAGAGYDLASGLGSPRCGLVNQIARLQKRVDTSVVGACVAPATYRDIAASDTELFLLNAQGDIERQDIHRLNPVTSTITGGYTDIDYVSEVAGWGILAARDADKTIYVDVAGTNVAAGAYPSGTSHVVAIAGMPQSGTSTTTLDVYVKLPQIHTGTIHVFLHGKYTKGPGASIVWDGPPPISGKQYDYGLFGRLFAGTPYLMDLQEYVDDSFKRWIPGNSEGIEALMPYYAHGYVASGVVDAFAPTAVDYSYGTAAYYALDDFTSGTLAQCIVKAPDAAVVF